MSPGFSKLMVLLAILMGEVEWSTSKGGLKDFIINNDHLLLFKLIS